MADVYTAQGAGGGAVSGAALGTQILPGYGTVIGAVLGAAAGYFGASMGGAGSTSFPPPPILAPK